MRYCPGGVLVVQREHAIPGNVVWGGVYALVRVAQTLEEDWRRVLLCRRPQIADIRLREKMRLEPNSMHNVDEPRFDQGDGMDVPRQASEPVVRDRIQSLANEQDYAVLCMQGAGQPYGALVAIAFTHDLRHAVFATPVTTRKYQLLNECDRVALIIDNRSARSGELMEIEAITVTGRSHLIKRGEEFEGMAKLLVSRHPYLKSFVKAASCAVFRVDVVRFLHVVRFQEVRQWIPNDQS